MLINLKPIFEVEPIPEKLYIIFTSKRGISIGNLSPSDKGSMLKKLIKVW